MKNLKFSVTAKSENPTKTIVQARSFTLTLDEPGHVCNGTDQGATPVEYLLASLSGCLNVVAHVVAKEMGIMLRGLTMEVEGDLNPARFVQGAINERSGFSEVRVKIHPDCDADEKSIQKWLLEIESRCPVSDNIINATPVLISLSPEQNTKSIDKQAK